MNQELPNGIQAVTFDNPVWGVLYDQATEKLIFDCRNEKLKEIQVVELDPRSRQTRWLDTKMIWREKIEAAFEGKLYSIQYEEENDPSKFKLMCTDQESGVVEQIGAMPEIPDCFVEPSFYDLDSDNNKIVTEFLGIAPVLPSEYLEIQDNIIISYYLRSEIGFDRFLLLLRDGKKQWKVRQDHQMKGFASGAFFVVDNMLVFVRDRHEVCISFF